MKVKTLEKTTKAWDKVLEVTTDRDETLTVELHWNSEYGYDILNWHVLPEYLIDQYDHELLASTLDECSEDVRANV
jgi:hypothetical protein